MIILKWLSDINDICNENCIPGLSGQGIQVSPLWVKNVSLQRHWSFMQSVGPLFASQPKKAHVPAVSLGFD